MGVRDCLVVFYHGVFQVIEKKIYVIASWRFPSGRKNNKKSRLGSPRDLPSLAYRVLGGKEALELA